MTFDHEVSAATLDHAAVASRQAEKEALQFECTMLEREVRRLVGLNHSLEVALALAERERNEFRNYAAAVNHSQPWRLIQTIRGWVGRRW